MWSRCAAAAFLAVDANARARTAATCRDWITPLQFSIARRVESSFRAATSRARTMGTLLNLVAARMFVIIP